ncbi:MAG TPA: hypothetical protein DCM87_19800 [Planctomycetes bacterium]|nr:hypothetical protein [Planctomycetota bacterium]
MSIRYRDAYTGRCVQRAWARILAAMWLGALTQGCGGLAKEVENGGVAVLQEELECAQRRLLEARHRFEEQGSKRTMWRGEFPTVEAAHMLGEYLPVVLDVGDDDTPDIYFYLAYSSVWSKFPEKRRYISQHFESFRSPVLKTCWALFLLEKGPLNDEVASFLRAMVKEGWRLTLFRELCGPKFEASKARIEKLESEGGPGPPAQERADSESERQTVRPQAPGAVGEPSEIHRVACGKIGRPAMAADGEGNALLAWSQREGDRCTLWMSRSTVGGGWEKGTVVRDAKHGRISDPGAAVNAGGDALIAWSESKDDAPAIWAARGSLGSGLGESATISAAEPGSQLRGVLAAVDGSGNGLVVWQRHAAGSIAVWGSYYETGVGWRTPEPVRMLERGAATSVCLSMTEEGDALAVWREFDARHSGIDKIRPAILARRFRKASGWGDPEVVQLDTTRAGGFPSLAMNAKGFAVALWSESTGDGVALQARCYHEENGWEDGVSTVAAGAVIGSPSLAMDENGDCVAVWEQYDEPWHTAYASRYSYGVGWCAPVSMRTPETGSALVPSVAAGGMGRAVAVWCQHYGEQQHVWASVHGPETGWRRAESVQGPTLHRAENPSVVAGRTGNAIAAWCESRGDSVRIVGRQLSLMEY